MNWMHEYSLSMSMGLCTVVVVVFVVVAAVLRWKSMIEQRGCQNANLSMQNLDPRQHDEVDVHFELPQLPLYYLLYSKLLEQL